MMVCFTLFVKEILYDTSLSSAIETALEVVRFHHRMEPWKRRVSEFINRHVGVRKCIHYTCRELLWSKIVFLGLNTRLERRLSLAVKLFNLTRS